MALQFEWAWTKPHQSTRLKGLGLTGKSRTELLLPTKLRVLAAMLRHPAWARLPLTLQWSACASPALPPRAPLY